MKKKIVCIVCVALMLLIVCTGCGSSANLKGEWKQEVAGVELYGFKFTGNTVEMFTTGVSAGIYDYEIVDDDTIRVSLGGVESEWDYSLDGDKLKLTISGIGSPIELTRK